MTMGAPERRVLPDPAARREPRPITDEERAHLERLASLLRSLRLSLPAPPGRRRVSQEHLADVAGISQPHISFLEGGRFRPRETTLRRIAGALAELGGGEAGQILAELLEAVGPALAEPSPAQERVEWNRDRRLIRRARRQRKEAKLEGALLRLAEPALERELSRRRDVQAELDRLGARARSVATRVPEAPLRPDLATHYPDGAPRGSQSVLIRRFQERVIAAVEARFGPVALADDVRLARRQARLDREKARSARRAEQGAAEQERFIRRAEEDDARHQDAFADACDLLAEHGLRQPPMLDGDDEVTTVASMLSRWVREAPAGPQTPLTGDAQCH